MKRHIVFVAVVALTAAACGGETSDGTGDGGGQGGGPGSSDDCANGFPESGSPCHAEGKFCIEEAAECPVGVLVCRGGKLVYDHDGCRACTSQISGQSCTTCTPPAAAECECSGGGWSCASERDAGNDASDAADAGDAG